MKRMEKEKRVLDKLLSPLVTVGALYVAYLWLSSLSIPGRIALAIAVIVLGELILRVRPSRIVFWRIFAFIFLLAMIFLPRHEVYGPFDDIYQRYKKDLGNPVAGVEPLLSPDDINNVNSKQPYGVHQFFHERAMVLFVHQSDDLFILPNVPEERPQARRIVGTYIPPEQDQWYTYAALRQKFQVPADPDLHPPYGGVAWHWYHDPDPWKSTLGWQVWNCLYKSHVTYSQRFEHGTVYGIFRVYTPKLKDNPDGQALVLLDDKSFYWQRTSAPSAPCEAKLDDDAKQP